MIASVPTSLFFNSGAFVADPPSTFPGFDVTGLAFDPDTVEKASIFLVAPGDWPSVTINIVGTSEATGTAVFHIDAPSSEDPVSLVVSSSFALVREPLAENISFGALTGTDFLGTPSALFRDATSGSDNLDADFIVWGLELLRGE